MEKLFKMNSDIHLTYTVSGQGIPLVFIHGLGGSYSNWHYTIPFFKEQGYQAIAFDLPGYGKSTKPKIAFTIAEYAKILKAFLDHLALPEAPVIVGNSMGGHIGVYFAAKYKSRLKALVLVDSSGLNELSFLEETMINLTFDQNNIGSLLKHTIDFFSRNIFYNPGSPGSQLFIQEQKEMSRRKDYKEYCYALETSTKAMMNTPIKDLLTEIQVPVQIIWGANDRLVPSFYGEKFQKYCAGSQLALIDQCGHVPELEKPDEFNRLVFDFLQKQDWKGKTKKRCWLCFFSSKNKV